MTLGGRSSKPTTNPLFFFSFSQTQHRQLLIFSFSQTQKKQPKLQIPSSSQTPNTNQLEPRETQQNQPKKKKKILQSATSTTQSEITINPIRNPVKPSEIRLSGLPPGERRPVGCREGGPDSPSAISEDPTPFLLSLPDRGEKAVTVSGYWQKPLTVTVLAVIKFH
jgi:hypothetical protein